MSNIILHSIYGLNRLDTPVFSSLAAQKSFFADYNPFAVGDDSFYVPKFKDTITLPMENIPFDEGINYLSINFNDKDYYYFIDKLTYVSEDLVSLDISMDVIQTYMFDIMFISSEIDRESITRWDSDYNINRAYIRENFSNGLFKNMTFRQTSRNNYGVIMFKMTQGDNYAIDFDDGQGNYPLYASYTKYHYSIFLGNYCYVFMIVPLEDGIKISVRGKNQISGTQTYFGVDYDITYPYFHFIQQLTAMQSQANAVEAYILPGDYVEELGFTVTYDAQNSKYIFTNTRDSLGQTCYYKALTGSQVAWENVAPVIFPYNGNFIPSLKMYYNYNLPFERNTDPTEPFDMKYCPQLIDENYFRVYFGERSALTSYPMSLCETLHLSLNGTLDPDELTRKYWIVEANYESFDIRDDYYRTCVYSKTIEALPLFNDAYNEYVSRNYSSLTRGIALQKEQTLFYGVTGILRDQSSRATKFTKGDFGDNKLNKAMQIGDAALNLELDIATISQKMYEIDTNLLITKENQWFTPDTVKQGNSASSDIMSSIMQPVEIVEMCTNIDTCAEIYEALGYKVHRITTDNLFHSHNRYYYDVIKADVNIVLTNVISDETTLAMIKERFSSGLRLWHTDSDGLLVCEETSGVHLHMGQVCKYDNVEV